MKVLLTLLVGMLLVGCQPSDEPATTPESATPESVQTTAEVHADDSPTPSPLVEPEPARPVLEQELAYGDAGDSNLIGYLAMPADAAEPLPGLLVIHEWWGLNDNIRAMTRRLAGEGYVVLAVDLYGESVADTPERAEELMTVVLAEPDAVRNNIRQAYEYLDNYAFAPSIGSIGWCLGGGWSLQTALMFPDELDAMVMYYGQIVTAEEELQTLNMPMLGLFAELDQTIPVSDVQRFRVALAELGKNSEVLIYSGVDHAFANPSGGNYDARTAELGE